MKETTIETTEGFRFHITTDENNSIRVTLYSNNLMAPLDVRPQASNVVILHPRRRL